MIFNNLDKTNPDKTNPTHSKYNNQFYLSCFKIIIYGIVTPSIITIGIYYTFTTGIKHSIKNIVRETINESLDLSFGKFNIGDIFKKNDK